MIRHIAEVFAAVLAIGGSVACFVCGGEAKAAGSGDGQDLAGTLGVLESKSFEAWKAGDKAFWTTFLSEKFVGWGSSGRLDKTSAMRALSSADCRIISYRLSNEQVSRLTSDAAVVTHKTEVDGICGGKQLAPTRLHRDCLCPRGQAVEGGLSSPVGDRRSNESDQTRLQ